MTICKSRHVSRKRVVRTHRTTYVARTLPTYKVPAQYIEVPRSETYVSEPYRVETVKRVRLDDEGPVVPDADYYDTARIASDYGFRDGWIDGRDAGMERDAYHPENSGDFQKATNGYEDSFGSKQLYKQAYRSAYMRGYKAGFRSIANRTTIRASRNW